MQVSLIPQKWSDVRGLPDLAPGIDTIPYVIPLVDMFLAPVALSYASLAESTGSTARTVLTMVLIGIAAPVNMIMAYVPWAQAALALYSCIFQACHD
jgi:hypothetical protein